MNNAIKIIAAKTFIAHPECEIMSPDFLKIMFYS